VEVNSCSNWRNNDSIIVIGCVGSDKLGDSKGSRGLAGVSNGFCGIPWKRVCSLLVKILEGNLSLTRKAWLGGAINVPITVSTWQNWDKI